jgi:hypothetical protein
VGCAASAAPNVDNPNAGTSGTASAPDAEKFCGTFCDRTVGCDDTRDEQTCKNACANQNAAIFPKLRADVVGLIEDCLTGKDCRTVLSSDVISTCQGEAVASVAPSAAAIDLCDALTAAETKCGHTGGKAQCLDMAKLYNDTTLKDAHDCASKACADQDACVSAALGGIGTGTVVPDAGPPPANDAGTTTCGLATTSACMSCMSSSCRSELTACENDASCGSFLQCWSSCGSSASCVAQCNAQDPGDTMRGQLVACLAGSCCSACAQ